MRIVLALAVMLGPAAYAGSMGKTKGALIFEYDGKTCVPDRSKSVVFGTGSFPFTPENSRVEAAFDVSNSEKEIRLRLHGWVSEMTDYRDAFLSIRGAAQQLNKFRSDPNIGSRYLNLTTDPRCARTAALVDVVEYFYDWKPPVTAADDSGPAKTRL